MQIVNKPLLKISVFLMMFIMFSGIFILSVDDADALKAKGTKSLSPKSFGASTSHIVCGDKLCSDISSIDFSKSSQTSVKLISSVPIIPLSNNDVFELSASNITKVIDGKSLQMFGYNQQTPGPLLLVKQGDEISVTFRNNLDFPTTVHWHGLRLDYTSDGVPGITQEPILPGDTFVYQLKFPDAGIFIYHPHVRTEMQMELGLYGNILVEPKIQNPTTIDYQVPLILDDISLTEEGLQKFDPNIVTYTLMGRFGNTMMINGDTNYSLQVKQGEIVRFYLTNTANTRTFNFAIEDHKIKLVADDASPYEQEKFVDSILLASSERRSVDVLFENPGQYKILHTTP